MCWWFCSSGRKACSAGTCHEPRAIALIVAVVLLLTVPYWVPGVYYVNVASQILFSRSSLSG